MSDKPPTDLPPDDALPDDRTLAADSETNPGIDSALAQITAALAEAGIHDPSLQSALTEKLRETLGTLSDLGDVDLTVDVVHTSLPQTQDPQDEDNGETEEDGRDTDGHSPPEVTVVDGGRARGQPRVSHPRPDLRVAVPTAEDATAGDATAGDATPGDSTADGAPGQDAEPTVTRRRLHLQRTKTGPTLSATGRIAVPPDGRQAVYRGSRPHPYRVLCDAGRLAVSVDGRTAETLSVGQSLDIEGTTVVVMATDGKPASGRYARLR